MTLLTNSNGIARTKRASFQYREVSAVWRERQGQFSQVYVQLCSATKIPIFFGAEDEANAIVRELGDLMERGGR